MYGLVRQAVREELGGPCACGLDQEKCREIGALAAKIAQAPDGAYIRSTNQSIGLDEIVRTINNMEKGDLAALRFEEFNEQFQYLIGAALVLLLLEFLLLDRRNPLLRRFNIFGTDTEK